MKKLLLLAGLLVGFIPLSAQPKKGATKAVLPVYKQATAPREARVQDLLSRMNRYEKIGQMTQLCASSITLDGTKNLDLNTDKIRGFILQNHVGSFLSGTGPAQKWVKFLGAVQRVAITESRLGIPIIFGIDHVHGAGYVDEGTFLPHQLNLGCSFDTGLVGAGARLCAAEQVDLGMGWNFAPVVDVGRNPAWPRLYETYGEDALLCGSLGATFIRNFQRYRAPGLAGMAACAKHFVGYSDPKSGWDRTPSDISDQSLQEVYLPPFDSAVRAGVQSVMVNSGELNGEPVHTSRYLLDGLLRRQLGFKGVLLTDIKDILKVVQLHGGAATEREATRLALEAGIDMSMACSGVDFQGYVRSLLDGGELSPSVIDTATARILRLKFALGLFEHPYPALNKATLRASKQAREQAREAALRTMVLLQNDGDLLPLSDNPKTLLAGHAANSRRIFNGPWTMEWMGAEEARQPQHMPTLAQALQVTMPGLKVAMPGADSLAFLKDFTRQVEEAEQVVLTIGEQPYSEFKGNTNTLRLDAFQQQLIDVAASRRPTLLIMLAGRPQLFSIPAGAKVAVVWAGIPGQGGPEALAQLLMGKADFSAKLSFSYPATDAHLVAYDHKRSDRYQPRYAFGHGLHYGKVSYVGVEALESVQEGKALQGSITIQNKGKLPLHEPILLYLEDSVGRITRPTRKLVWFTSAALAPGEKKVVSFTVPAAAFSYPDKTGRRIYEKRRVYLHWGGEAAVPVECK